MIQSTFTAKRKCSCSPMVGVLLIAMIGCSNTGPAEQSVDIVSTPTRENSNVAKTDVASEAKDMDTSPSPIQAVNTPHATATDPASDHSVGDPNTVEVTAPPQPPTEKIAVDQPLDVDLIEIRPSAKLRTARFAASMAATLINKAKASRREAKNAGYGDVLPIEEIQADQAYKKAIEYFNQVTEEDPQAVYTEMATLHCVMGHFEEGFTCAQKSVEHGSAIGMCLLGQLYTDGKGVDADPAKAFHWFLKSHQADYHLASMAVAELYLSGTGVEQDAPAAIRILEAEIERKNPDAQFRMADLLAEGKVVPQDGSRSFDLLEMAADAGHPEACYRMGTTYDRTKHYDIAAEYFAVAAMRGIDAAQVRLGTMYANGQGVPYDMKAAIRWWEIAANAGNEIAKRNLVAAKDAALRDAMLSIDDETLEDQREFQRLKQLDLQAERRSRGY